MFPIGGGLWIPIFHPELRISTPYREWNFTGDVTRMPEFCAPALGNRANVVTIDADIPENGSGVLYSLGGAGGGLTCYLDDGILCYEYNLFIIMRTKIRSTKHLPAGRSQIRIETAFPEPRPGGPLDVSTERERRAVRPGSGADQRPAHLHRQRLSRHWAMPRRSGLARLLRSCALSRSTAPSIASMSATPPKEVSDT